MSRVQEQRLAKLFKAPKDRPSYLAKYGPTVLSLRNRHQGQTVFLLGNGPTLAEERLDLLRDASTAGLCKTIGINKSHLIYHSDYISFVDRPYTQKEYFYHLIEPYVPDRVFTSALYGNDIGVPFMISSKQEHSWTFNWDLYNDGVTVQTAGWFTLQVACWLGFTRIYLLGFDGVTDYGTKPGGNHHFYGTRNANARESVCQFPPAYVTGYNRHLPGVLTEMESRGIFLKTCAKRRNILPNASHFQPLESVLDELKSKKTPPPYTPFYIATNGLSNPTEGETLY